MTETTGSAGDSSGASGVFLGTRIMGVVNVTPDSFSDGGRWFDHEAAIAHGHELIAQGAHILDIGGESTRPGSMRPDQDEELRRVIPVVRELAATGVPVSVDTMRAKVAQESLAAGAAIINDVSGGVDDPDMVRVAVEAQVPFVAMHWRGHGSMMHTRAIYDDVVDEVLSELAQRRDVLLAAGIRPENLILDPGLGFAKEPQHNWDLLASLDGVHALGHRVLVGASRKRFLARVEEPTGRPMRQFVDSDAETAAVSVICALAGVWCVRVHDVDLTRRELAVAHCVLTRGAEWR